MSTEHCDNIVDFALEVFHGCRSDCYGCNVNKTDQDGFVANDLVKLDGLFADLLDNKYVLANLSIGPTDFFMASNTAEVMGQVSSLMDKFSCVVVNSTFLYPQEELERMAAVMLPHLLGRRVKFGFPVDPRHLGKFKYVETIAKNIEYFRSLLPGVDVVKVFAALNLKVYREVEADPIWNVEETLKLFHQHHIDFEFVLTEGRLDTKDLNNKEKLKQSFLYVKKIHDQEDIFPKEMYDFLKLATYYREAIQLYGIDSQGRKFRDIDFVYKNGKIYNTVFSGEAVALFHDSLAIDNSIQWDTAALVELRNRILVEQIEYLEKTKECGNCEFVSSCMEKGYIQVMKIAGTRSCIVSKSSYEKNRNVLQSPSRKLEYTQRFHEEDHPNPTIEGTTC